MHYHAVSSIPFCLIQGRVRQLNYPIEERRLTDERILGSGDFVRHILQEADDKLKNQFSADERREKMKEVIQELCKNEGVNIVELQSVSRRGRVSQARFLIACRLIETYGIPLAEVARQVGVSTSAISKIITRNSNKST